MSNSLRVLVLGDVVGQAGVRALIAGLPTLVAFRESDFVIVNAENSADGFGLTTDIAERLFEAGVSVITTGNHVWQRREILDYLDHEHRVLRPANYPGNPPGVGWNGFLCGEARVAVLNLQGRVRLSNVDCPFRVARTLLGAIKQQADIVLVDFHAEDTEEKEAMGFYLDGEVSAIFGTHTHVQTADERILEGGTAYITDIGMTGAVDSVIGFESPIAVERMVNQMPLKMKVSNSIAAIHGVAMEFDLESNRALAIERIDYTPGA